MYGLFADRPGLKGTEEIGKLNAAVLRSLRLELAKTHRHPIKGDVTVTDALLARVPQLRYELSPKTLTLYLENVFYLLGLLKYFLLNNLGS